MTLLTGDKVRVQLGADGRPIVRQVTAAPRADGSTTAFHTLIHAGDTYVIPSDALSMLASHTIDWHLFDIAELVASGYDDERTDQLPIIVQYPHGRSDLAQQQLPATTPGHVLDSIDATAVGVRKSEAGQFWAALSRHSPVAAAKVWLDRKVTVALDKSVPQIGAPAAWAAGFDGSGVRIAVLDTGLDAGHPDFAGKVVAARSFVPGVTSTQDGHGHGTHVSSIAAGTGAADHGVYKGVAPGAQLIVGKVLDDNGSGQASWAIEAMEWATRTEHADVVNMSLTGGATDGTDPMSQAVNDLSETTGALFTIAAGNSGPRADTVASPGAADLALTVAAVDKSDRLADFSSRGPRVGDRALKPDLAAPGVDIVAARAAGSSLGQVVDDHYMMLSGTSMAAPHAAGAAAILAQQHPDWDGQTIKAALTSTAFDVGYTAYQQGSGRLDVGRASGQSVHADAGLNFGVSPYGDRAPRTKTITYTNDSHDPVTLELHGTLSSYTGSPAPHGMLGLAQNSLTVPANGRASVTVALDPSGAAAGAFQGVVTATDPTGKIKLRTTIGAYLEPQHFDLTLEVTPPRGATDVTVSGGLVVREDGRDDLDDGPIALAAGLRAGAHLLGGTYSVQAVVSWRDAAGERQYALPIAPEVAVGKDTTVRFDLNAARRLTIRTPTPTESYDGGVSIRRVSAGSGWDVRSELASDYGSQNYWLLPTRSVKLGAFHLATEQLRGAAPVTMQVVGPGHASLHPQYQAADDTVARLKGRAIVPLQDVGLGRPEDFARIHLRGALVLMRPTDICTNSCGPAIADRIDAAAQAGAIGVVVAGPAARVSLGDRAFALPVMTLPADEAESLAAGAKRAAIKIRFEGQTGPHSVYSLAFSTDGGVPAVPTYEVKDRELYKITDRVHADRPAGTHILRTTNDLSNTLSTSFTLDSPGTMTEYVGPVSATRAWTRAADQTYDGSADTAYESADETFPNRGSRTEDWYSVPQVPGVPAVPASVGQPRLCMGLCRAGDTVLPWFWLTSDEPTHSGSQSWYGGSPGDQPVPQETLSLSTSGRELPLELREVHVVAGWAAHFWWPAFTVPTGKATYQLAERYRSPLPSQRYATEVDTDLTFVTERPDPSSALCLGQWFPIYAVVSKDEPCAALPSLHLRYDVGADLDNTLPAGRVHTITITPYQNGLLAAGPKVKSLQAWVSYDDGSKWQEVAVRPAAHGAFIALLKHPQLGETAGAVSLRFEARDAAGTSIRQTIHRAYGLR
ncbi:S8 family peptidase [Kribbella sp. NPDC051586]|uniref:S8 family peptidase n=1 Tax=Kribbella sp. NPDC051586 TaxID=3364118 RepID=UPI0037876E3E